MAARDVIRGLIVLGFERDMQYLGAYRAWQEAVLIDAGLARKQKLIHAWTSARVAGAFRLLQRLPGARSGVDIDGLAQVLDSLFWSLLAMAARRRDVTLRRAVDGTVHLIHHALFVDRRRF
jgi:hypothetical protein